MSTQLGPCPRLNLEVWEKIKDKAMVRGGWSIDGKRHVLALAPTEKVGGIEWVLMEENPPGSMPVARLTEEGWELIHKGTLLAEKNAIRKGRSIFHLQMTNHRGRNVVQVVKGSPPKPRSKKR